MKIKYVTASIALALTLTACGGDNNNAVQTPTLGCDAAGVLPQVEQPILNETALLMRRATERDLDGGYNAEATAAALRDFGMTLNDVRTVSETGEGAARTLTCEATLRLTVSPHIRERLQAAADHFMQVYETDGVDIDSIMGSANGYLKPEGEGRYSAPIQYTVQLTDRADKIIARADVGQVAQALETPLRFYLGHDSLARAANSLVQAAASEEARIEELERLNQARLQDGLALAQQENRHAQSDLDKAWLALPETVRNDMNAEQNQWIKARQSECAYYGKSQSSEPMEQNIASLQCETSAIRERVQQLQGKAGANANHAIASTPAATAPRANSDVHQQRQAAERQLRAVWGSIPDDVKAHLQDDYRSWQQSFVSKCSQAAHDEVAQIARLQCETQAVREKTEELRGFAPK